MATDTVRSKPLLIFGVVGLVGFLLDRVTKMWALNALTGDEPVHWLLHNILGFQLQFNYGASFSIGQSATWLFTFIGALAVIAFPFLARQGRGLWAAICGLLWAGALGNLLDRLIGVPHGQGPVVDFIVYADFFTGNVADIFIFLGCCFALLFIVIGRSPFEEQSRV